MVLPAGEHTSALSLEGSTLPFWAHIRAEPSTVCTAKRLASVLGRPVRTAPSISASMNMYTKAGPQPVRALPMSSFFSSISLMIPAGRIRSIRIVTSSSEALPPLL